MSPPEIFDTGFTVVHEPKGPNPSTPLVDIVFIHGLQGHPYRTWTYPPPPSKSKPTPPEPSSESPTSITKRSFGKKLLGLATPFRKKDRGKARAEWPDPGAERTFQDADRTVKDTAFVFWPADLLPESCPRARILVWGYDTKVAKLPGQAVSKSNVFSEGKNLLFAFARERELDTPIIFVAHSLGGVVLKEALAISYESDDTDLKNVARSTEAVIFMGTPHRGSKDIAGVGEIARRIASAFMIDTNSAMLDSLGLKNSDLQRCEDSFSRIWNAVQFKIKTFQEGMPYTGVNIGLLNEKVVPDDSSRIGDPRERAETLEANHMDMCRFWGKKDPKYRKVRPELAILYKSITKPPHAPASELQTQPERYMHSESEEERQLFLRKCEDVRALLKFREIGRRRRTIETALKDTCEPLLRSETYEWWFSRKNVEQHRGLLLIRGKPGSGKSTLMKEAVREARDYQPSENRHIVDFFFNARGNHLERSEIGFFRAIVYQLLPLFREQVREFIESWSNDNEPAWVSEELQDAIRTMFSERCGTGIFIFVDGLDECEGYGRILYFLGDLCNRAFFAGVRLNVCVSSRHYQPITIARNLKLVLEDCNGSAIERFVDEMVSMSVPNDLYHGWDDIKVEIVRRASGIFLWAKLVLDPLLAQSYHGKNTLLLKSSLPPVPDGLNDLYTKILWGMKTEELGHAAKLFSWMLFSQCKIKLDWWYQLVAFIGESPPKSLAELRDLGDELKLKPGRLEDWAELRKQIDRQKRADLENRIRGISRGLVEIQRPEQTVQDPFMDDERESVQAAPGSDTEEFETLEFIHESVREFFLQKGLGLLFNSSSGDAIGDAHGSILTTCFDYLGIEEFDDLVNGNRNAPPSEASNPYRIPDPPNSGAPAGPFERRGSFESMRSRHSGSSNVGSSASNYGHRSTHSLKDRRSSRSLKGRRSTQSLKGEQARPQIPRPEQPWILFPPIPTVGRAEHSHTSSSPLLPPVLGGNSINELQHNELPAPYSGPSNTQAQYQPGETRPGTPISALPSPLPPFWVAIQSNLPGTPLSNPRTFSDRARQNGPVPSCSPPPNIPPYALTEDRDFGTYSIPTQRFFADLHENASVPEDDHHTASVRSQVQQLAGPSGLFNHIIDMIIPHAVAAEEEGYDPSMLISRLQSRDLWIRWVPFCDKMTSDTSLLYFAAEQGLLRWVSHLLDTGTSPNKLGGKLRYPLIAATYKIRKEVVHLLLDSGADPTVKDNLGQTFLHHLVDRGDHCLLRAVLDNHDGESTRLAMATTNMFGRTPFLEAAFWGDRVALEEFLKHGSNLYDTDMYQNSALDLARSGHFCDPKMIEYLMEQGLVSH